MHGPPGLAHHRAMPDATPLPAAAADLPSRLAAVRQRSLALVQGLSEADCQVQSMPDASPQKWHLAHTTWYFETFVLEAFDPTHRAHDERFRALFNSYYQGVGPAHPRPQRGLITRPGLAEVLAWRGAVDARLAQLLHEGRLEAGARAVLALGLQHEQQHQELMQTDLLHLLSCNPLHPARHAGTPPPLAAEGQPAWVGVEGGRVAVGHAGPGFAFDNETPRHAAWLEPFELADRLVTQGQWQAFCDDAGYATPRWWTAAGWDWVCQQRIVAPLHWVGDARFTLHGLQPRTADEPVAHLSWYEADAYARWHAAQHPGQPPSRLPTEAEWEHAAATCASHVQQLHGALWQWTASAYAPYPGLRPWAGTVGEYNAKFMVNQLVLRGSSWATPPGHARDTYRNFFPPDARLQFTGLRLARDGAD
jgi:ergothioneine biosynthesis protein EgtB